MRKFACLVLLWLALLPVVACAVEVTLSDNGMATFQWEGWRSAMRQVTLTATLPGVSLLEGPELRALPGGGLERIARYGEEKQGALITERFLPSASGLDLEVTLEGTGITWSGPIALKLTAPAEDFPGWWTAWGTPDLARENHWQDPLAHRPRETRTLSFGGTSVLSSDAFSLPLVCLFAPDKGLGLTLLQAPSDLLRDMKLVSEEGSVSFIHERHRLEQGKQLTFHLRLVAHAADWRAGVAELIAHFPEYFYPEATNPEDLAGLGAYSSEEAPLEAYKLNQLGFRTNWKASFDFPYMGMFLPPLAPGEEWDSFNHRRPSIASMEAYSKAMRAQGFRVLNYFNVNEFGTGIKWPSPASGTSPTRLWSDPNAYLYGPLKEAWLRDGEGKPVFSWEWSVGMDPGAPAYQAFLIEQAERHLRFLPSSSGFCIDRLDWTRWYNKQADDGASWVEGVPARSLIASWHEVIGKLAPLVHAQDKAIFVNPLNRRIDLMNHVDGFYDEIADRPECLNSDAFLGLIKPSIAWVGHVDALRPSPDAVLQHYLYMGIQPTAPVAGNDHTIRPDFWAEGFYLDYAPLFKELRGRRWVLSPLAAEADSGVLANVFEVPGGYVVPLILGGEAKTATVRLRRLVLPCPVENLRIDALAPGQPPLPVELTKDGAALVLETPLAAGCALVRLSWLWAEDEGPAFTESTKVSLRCVVSGAEVHYTTDGTEPRPDSKLYARPLVLNQTTDLRAAAFAADKQVGRTLQRTYARCAAPAPVATVREGTFETSLTVDVTRPRYFPGGQVRYTLDSSKVSNASALWTGPIPLTETATLRARLFDGNAGGDELKVTYSRWPPVPPVAEVFCSDLPWVSATTGWGGFVRRDLSTQDQPLTLHGQVFEKGLGGSASSEIIYDLEPEWRRFVSTVGVDDEMNDWDLQSIQFSVWVDGKLLAESPILRRGDLWRFNIALPEGGNRFRLFAWDTGDSINCDHADWGGAGFLLSD